MRNVKSEMDRKLIIFFLVFWGVFLTGQAVPAAINPVIKAVSTGPVDNYYVVKNTRFRMVTALSKDSLSLHLEKVEYGKNNSYVKVIDKFTIEPALLKGEKKFYSASNVEWLCYNSFKFRGIPTLYTIKYIDGKYTVTIR